MKIETLDEGLAEQTDNSEKFQNLDVTTELTIADKIEKSDKPNEVKYAIGLIFKLTTENKKIVFYAYYVGQYLLTMEKDLTLEEFSDFYKKPYNSFKDYFDNYKKGKTLEPINFPKFNKDLNLTITAFKERIPDLLSE